MNADDELPGRYASPPCLASELAPEYFDPIGVDPQQARDVARWRRAERARLRSERDAMSARGRHAAEEAIAKCLRAFLSDRFGGPGERILSAYWPMHGEPDLRALMSELDASGVTIALPVVETKARPLVFRHWTPSTRMVRGVWNIPVPADDTETVTPTIVLAPVIGWDAEGYRLGYGGGYFDRTLAAMTPRPFSIGIGFGAMRIATIYPQPYDIALDTVVTETGVEVARATPRVFSRTTPEDRWTK